METEAKLDLIDELNMGNKKQWVNNNKNKLNVCRQPANFTAF